MVPGGLCQDVGEPLLAAGLWHGPSLPDGRNPRQTHAPRLALARRAPCPALEIPTGSNVD